MAYRTAGLVYSAIEGLGQRERREGDSLDLKLRTFAEFSVECAVAKVVGSETYHGLSDEALQVYGGYGFSEEYPAARWYRDSRITRIYEGTSEICRLSIAKTLLKRADRGELALRNAVAALTPASDRPVDNDLPALGAQVHALKQLFLFVLGQVWDNLDATQLLDPSHQQFLGSLADIVIETYLAESTVLRVLKLTRVRPEADLRSESALARLVFYRSADRVRQESTDVLAALLEDDRLLAALDRVAAWLPAPTGLIESRALVARELVARNGILSA